VGSDGLVAAITNLVCLCKILDYFLHFPRSQWNVIETKQPSKPLYFKKCINLWKLQEWIYIEVWLLLIGLILITWQALLPHKWQPPSVTFGSRNSYKKKWNRRPLFEACLVWTWPLFSCLHVLEMCAFWQINNILSRVFTPSSLAAAEGCGQNTAQKNLRMIESTQPVLPTVTNPSCKCRRWMTGIFFIIIIIIGGVGLSP
jgi:hypothetical protein